MNKKDNFNEILNRTSLSDTDKKYIASIFNYFNGEYLQILANRIFLFEGEPGIGKTFLAKELINSVGKPTLFLGQTNTFSNAKKVKTLKELLELLENFDEGIVYVDDLKYVFNFNDYDDMDSEEKHRFMKLLESFKDNNKKTILIMTLNDSDFMDDSWKDRIDIHINFEFPSNKDKLNFLKEKFSEYVGLRELKYLSENTIGYNYRDLPQIIKIAYHSGNRKIELNSIKEALLGYTPSSLSNFNIKQGIKIKLDDLFLKEELRKELNKVSWYIKKREELLRNNATRSNFLIFEGPAGVGKTHSALALAGEIGIPLIKIGAREFFGRRFGPNMIFGRIKRFHDAIVLIDDADKVINGDAFSMNDGGALTSELNSQFDDLEKTALVILSVNDSKRLGTALRNRFKVIKFENPGLGEREQYFSKVIKNSKIRFNFSEADIANITQGMNYRDMQRFWNECVFYAIENNLKVLRKEDIISIASPREKIESNMFG